MTRPVLLIDIGAGALPATTPPASVSASWVPAVYVPPPVPVPGGFATATLMDAVLLTWSAIAATSPEYVIERAPDVAGAPGAWSVIARTTDLRYTVAVAGGIKYWWRVKAIVFGRSSAVTAAISRMAVSAESLIGVAVINPKFELELFGWTNTHGLWAAMPTNGVGGSLYAELAGAASTAWLVNNGRLAVKPGATLQLSAHLLRAAAAGDGSLYLGAFYYDGSGSPVAGGGTHVEASKVSDVPNNGDYYLVKKTVTVPATAAQAEFVVSVAGQTAGGAWAVDNVSMVVLANADEVPDGVQNTVIDVDDRFNYSGRRRLGLRIAGSGHRIGDQRNLPQSNTTAYGSVRSTTVLSATSAGAVSVNAHSVRYGGTSVAYSAVANAITGLTQSVNYVIYCFDDGYAGGVRTWLAGTNPDAVMQLGDGVVVAGEITIPTSGSSSGGGGSGGGGGWCVDADMVLPDGRRAGDILGSEAIACWNDDAEEPGLVHLLVESNTLVPFQPCLTLVTASGAQVTASESTPMTLRDGRTAALPEMLGEDALVRHGDGTLAWEPVTALRDAGLRTVAKIKVHQRCYFAGAVAAATVATHNPINKP